MKQDKIIEKLETHLSKKLYLRLTRKKASFEGISTGYIIDKSSDFILLQETDDFRILGYLIIPIKTIKHVRYNQNDKTIQHILKHEGLINDVGAKYKVDWTDWNSILKDIKATKLIIISECERPDQKFFCIGRLKRINKKSVSIRYFNAQGVLDKQNTKHNFDDITKLSFDDRYANVFSKYLIDKEQKIKD